MIHINTYTNSIIIYLHNTIYNTVYVYLYLYLYLYVYRTICHINHSCDPNVIVRYSIDEQGGKLVIIIMMLLYYNIIYYMYGICAFMLTKIAMYITLYDTILHHYILTIYIHLCNTLIIYKHIYTFIHIIYTLYTYTYIYVYIYIQTYIIYILCLHRSGSTLEGIEANTSRRRANTSLHRTLLASIEEKANAKRIWICMSM